MGKKIKSFATLLVALSTAFSVAALVSCTDTTDPDNGGGSGTTEVTKTLVSIAVTNEPSTTSFIVGQNFRYNGIEVTATYDDNSTAVVTNFTVETPDMTTAGEKPVTVSYTEGTVTATTSYTITVEEDSYVSVSIDTSWTLEIGMDVANLEPTVIGTLGSGTSATLSSDEYTISVTDTEGVTTTDTYVQGETTYNVTVALTSNPSLTDTKSYTTGSATSFKYEAEDAVRDGFVEESNGIVYTSTGSSYAGGTLTFTVYALAGNYNLSFYAGSMLCIDTRRESSPDYGLENAPVQYYIQLPNAVNDTVDLKVNGNGVNIDDTAVFTNLGSYAGVSDFLSNFQLIQLTNVTLQNGANTLEFTFGESKSGITNIQAWNEGRNPPSFNVDYIQFDKADPANKTISGIDIETEPYVKTYEQVDSNDDVKLDTRGLLIKVIYSDNSSAYVCNNFTTEYDFTKPASQKVTVKYGDYSDTYDVFVRGDPTAIKISDAFTLNAGDDLSSLELGVTATYSGYEGSYAIDSSQYDVTITDSSDNDVSEPTALIGKTYKIKVSYTLRDGSTTVTDTVTVTATNSIVLNAEDQTYENGTARTTYGTSNYIVEFDLAPTFTDNTYTEIVTHATGYIEFSIPYVEAGTYNLTMAMFNGKVFDNYEANGSVNNADRYDPQDINLENVFDVTIDSNSVDLTGKVLEKFTNKENNSNVMRYESNKVDCNFGDFTLTEGTHTFRIDITTHINEMNRWHALLVGFDTLTVTTATISG